MNRRDTDFQSEALFIGYDAVICIMPKENFILIIVDIGIIGGYSDIFVKKD